MLKKIGNLLILAILLGAHNALAASIVATVDRTETSLEEPLELTVTVDGDIDGDLKMPEMTQFDIQSRGESTQVQIINGSMSRTVSYTFLLLPKTAGNFTINSVAARIDGRMYQSAPIQVRVTTGQPRPAAEADDAGGLAFLRAVVSNNAPYVGEQVVYTWRFFRRVRVGNAALTLPDFSGWVASDLGEQKEYQTVLNGQEYVVTELRKALVAQAPGALTIAPSSLRVDMVVPRRGRSARDDRFGGDPFGDIFGRGQSQTRVLKSDSLKLTVRALPPSPKGFSGLVGHYALHAELSKTLVKVGESTTLTIAISGTGNATQIPEPVIAGLENFKTYDDKPVVQNDSQVDALGGSKTFTKALVPQSAGEQVLPPIEMIYFDTSDNTYKTASSGELRLQVAPGEVLPTSSNNTPMVASPSKTPVQMLGDDLLPLHHELTFVRSTIAERAGLATAMLLPPLCFGLAGFLQRRRLNAGINTPLRRRQKALARARQALTQLDNHATASRIVRDYLGDKTSVEGLALTPLEAQQLVTEHFTSNADLPIRTCRFLEQCDAAQYSDQTKNTPADKLGQEAASLLNDLEKHYRG